VRLWYADRNYNLQLGKLVTLWTCHVSSGGPSNLAAPSAPLFVSMFPERDRSCHFMLHDQGDDDLRCRLPLGHREGQPLSGLMTLKNFMEGGNEVINCKIIVCVRAIGAKKKRRIVP